MRNRLQVISLLWAAIILGAVHSSFAAGTNYGTQVVQGSPSYSNSIWQPIVGGVLSGTAVGLANGNSYTCLVNGTNTVGANGAGAALNNTRIRSQPTAGVQVFPTNSVLIMNTNTELRVKGSGSGTYTIFFGGSNGSPGLIFNGGIIDDGDATTTYLVDGLIQVAAQSYISHGANGGSGGATTDRALVFQGVLSGAGNMVIMNSSSTLPQVISNVNNTFSGQWIVQCGFLRGAVSNSLGTNSITVNPSYTGYLADMPHATSPGGPAVFEVNYDINSAGVLTLTNGGSMRLHQTCVFSAVNIESGTLSPGTHFYSELAANFPSSFAAGGSGSITVRPYDPNQLILPPQFNTGLPQPEQVYAGGNVRFTATVTAATAQPVTYQWLKNGSPLSNGGNISGANTNTLIITGVSAGDVAGYSLVASNAGGPATSPVGTLAIVSPNGEAYEAAVKAANPFAFYQLNETGDPATNAIAYDNENGFNGVYGTGAQNLLAGTTGPGTADGFPGFAAGNGAVNLTIGNATSHITVATPWNINTNTVTMTAWINPNGPQNANEGLVFTRGGNTVAGLCLASALDANGQATLGYNWNNDSATFAWNSGIELPSGIWSFVALVITPSDATVYIMNTNGLASAKQTYPNPVQTFNGGTLIGDDSAGANGVRVFNGKIDDVAVFNRALAKSDLTTLFYAASGISTYAPEIVGGPTNLSLYAGQTATFSVAAGGSDPVTYQWLADTAGNMVFANLSDGGRFSGTGSQSLNIAKISSADQNNYEVIVSNGSGSVTSSVASLTVNPTGPPQAFTLNLGGANIQQAAGLDWNTVNEWNPNGQAASVSAVANPGSTFDVQIGQRLRNPAGSTVSTFPNATLSIDGPGILFDGNTTAGTNTGEFRFKHSIDPATVIFPKLILNGGQLDAGDNGTIIIQGEIDVNTNSSVTVDSAAGVAGVNTPRNYQVDAVVKSGPNGGNLRYNAIQAANPYTSSLDLTSSNNTFIGTWTVDSGTLVGAGSNSLGTNTITINAKGGLQTLYDVHNPNSDLILVGQMFLNQNDTFRSLFINGVPLAVGTYTAAQLNTMAPTNFPATWAGQFGATNTTNMSGSITVLLQPAPEITSQPNPTNFTIYPGQTAQFTATAGGNIPLFLFWQFSSNNTSFTFLSDNSQISGSATNTITIVAAANTAGYYRLLASNSIGQATSQVASVTLLATGPATNITFEYNGVPTLQPTGNDWNTPTNWSDGQPANISAFSNPGSTYEVVVGSRLRNPANVVSSTFPGSLLTIDGAGVLDTSDTTVGEFRFKHTPGGNAGNGIVTFPRLVLAGGQLDNGDNGLQQISGEIDVISNSVIYTDPAAGQDRPFEIDALLTGTGTITYQDFDIGLNGGLAITGNNNTFSGQWHIVIGCLVGAGANSLGTNNIIIENPAALETLYDIHSSGDLNLKGQFFLHQNETFHSMEVNNFVLAPGTYTWAQLNTRYPTNFPANWVSQNGSTFSSASGSVTVLAQNPAAVPALSSTVLSGGQIQLTWSVGSLYDSTNVTGPWTLTPGATSPFVVNTTDPQHYYEVK